jgi:hypothetical protein
VCALCVSLQKSSQQGPLYFVTYHYFYNTLSFSFLNYLIIGTGPAEKSRGSGAFD